MSNRKLERGSRVKVCGQKGIVMEANPYIDLYKVGLDSGKRIHASRGDLQWIPDERHSS